ncbi:anti-sigma factor domain-containing protein [Paenibacillus roseipurpureus]|uniref:Anti-sigma factor domain-containing protein n=1 Tax=Paenibacillus roseopurpureus TaxID=2918901 RepID=A0AA96LPZ7_9BACL|nr:anti-sigma factor domain-containing protein [Paenibacillus sp. MBLB1832]WNR43693.1 anti-sigma factor domain-containing protein [Paenibacillus sp. MBLB1832]
MNKGIVMELSENSIIVMNAEGRFEKLPRGTRSCELGEEILYAPVKRRLRVPQMAILSGLAAAIVVCFVLVSTLTGNGPGNSVVAYVTIDINPSVEIGIDNKEVVRDLHGLNRDGEQLIESLVFEGKSLADVTSAILDKAEQGALAKGEGDIIISSTVVGPKSNVNDEAIASKLKAQVNKHIEDSHPDQVKNFEVQAFAAPQEVRKEAQASGISAGKYAIYLNAMDNGVKVSLDDIKSTSIHNLAKENGGIQSFVKPDRPIDKNSLERLLADEKSGKLSERVQQMAEKSGSNNGSNKDNEKDKNNNGKNSNNGNNTGNTSHGQVTKPTATPKNNRDDSNKNDNNGRNNSNDRNSNNKDNKDNSKDDRSSTPKSDRKNDDDDDNDKKSSLTSKPTPTLKATVKPTIKPTSKPMAKPTLTPKGDGRFNGISWGWGNDGRTLRDITDWKKN